MKLKATLVFIAGVVVGAWGLAIAWHYEATRDIGSWLPVVPHIADVTIHTQTAKVGTSVATRSFTFTANRATSATEAHKLFEPELASQGWEQLTSSYSTSHASSYWRHQTKLNGRLYLLFSIAQIDPGGRDYIANSTTMIHQN